MGFFAKDIGLDLGTSNTVISVKGRGIVVREPSVVAIDKNYGTIIAIGSAAKEMCGRTPENIEAIDWRYIVGCALLRKEHNL